MRSSLVVALAVLVAACPGTSGQQANVDAGSFDAGPGAVLTGDGGGSVDGGSSDLDSGTVLVEPDAGALTPAEEAMLAARPYRLFIPDSYDGSTAVPFVLSLHGYTSSGVGQDVYFGLTAFAQSRGFIFAAPDGTLDPAFERFWNATDGCCNFASSTVDDVGYLTAILNQVSLRYRVDPKRVFILGHSNGGFMAHRLACERSDRFAGIAVLAGANWKDPSLCQPSDPVSVLQVHGTADLVIFYDGGAKVAGHPFPGAMETMQGWATREGCTGTMSGGPNLDLDLVQLGAETSRLAWTGCTGGAAELWTIALGSHIPPFTSQWPGAAYDWLMAHPKP